MFTVEPLRGIVLTHGLKRPRVYQDDVTVYKLYDTHEEEWAKPNVELVKRVLDDDYLCDIEELNLTTDGCFKCLKYIYIAEREKMSMAVEDFKPIMIILDKLHEAGYMHSDVRFPTWCSIVLGMQN